MAYWRNRSGRFVDKKKQFVTQKLKYCNTNVIGTLGCRKMKIETTITIKQTLLALAKGSLSKDKAIATAKGNAMNEFNNKKFVAVDDLIEELEDLHEMRRLELIKQLKGE